jgi:hypothetical protein
MVDALMEVGQEVELDRRIIDGIRVGDMWRLTPQFFDGEEQTVVFFSMLNGEGIYFYCIKGAGAVFTASDDAELLFDGRPNATYLGNWEDRDRRNAVFTPGEQEAILSIDHVREKLEDKLGVPLINENQLNALHLRF